MSIPLIQLLSPIIGQKNKTYIFFQFHLECFDEGYFLVKSIRSKMQITFWGSGCLDKGFKDHKCDCRLTLAGGWTHYTNECEEGAVKDALEREVRAGQTDLFRDWKQRDLRDTGRLCQHYLKSWGVGPEGRVVWNHQTVKKFWMLFMTELPNELYADRKQMRATFSNSFPLHRFCIRLTA